MSHKVTDRLFAQINELLGSEPFCKMAEILYNRGAVDALHRLRDEAVFRAENVEPLLTPFRLGKIAGYEWANEAAQFLIEEYEEEK